MKALSRRTFTSMLAVAPLAGSAAAAAAADDARGVEAAVADFYANISARNLAGVLRHMPPDGFTEFGVGAAEAGPLARHNFEAFFRSEPAIDLRAVIRQVQAFGDTAIVTGMRVGSITPKGQPVKESQAAMTMVWTKADGRWLLRHVHLSPVGPLTGR